MKAARSSVMIRACFLIVLAFCAGFAHAAPSPLDSLKISPYFLATGPFVGKCIGPKVPVTGGGATPLGLNNCKPCATWTPSGTHVCSFKFELTSLGQLKTFGCLTDFGGLPVITLCYAAGDSRVKSDQTWTLGSDGYLKAASGKCLGVQNGDARKLIMVACNTIDAVKFKTSSLA